MTPYEAAVLRLTTAYYNSGLRSVANPGGFGDDGHEVNFPAALADVGDVGAFIAAAAGRLLGVDDAAGAALAARDDVIQLVAFAEAAAAQFTPATPGQIRAGLDDVHFVTALRLMQAAGPVAVPYAANLLFDFAGGWNREVTLTGNPTVGEPQNARRGITYILDFIGGYQPAFHTCWDFGENLAPIFNLGAGKLNTVYARCRSVAPLRFTCTYWGPN